MSLETFFHRGIGAARRLFFRAVLEIIRLIHQRNDHWASKRRAHFAPLEWGRGVSVVIPERAGAEMLDACLESVMRAGDRLSSPLEVIVAVNGTPLSHYEHLMKKYPSVRFLHSKKPLSFSHAVLKGIRQASFGGIYLLNNDMVIDENALRALLPWRGPHVFAVASQIFFKDPSRRREETGWTDMRIGESGLEIFDVEPEDQTLVRGTLYAGGGASLFNRSLLLRLMSPFDPYGPFYWEDVEWGVRAWRMGYESLFCPSSQAIHRHRATVSKFFTEKEITRVFQRNSFQFILRNELGRFPIQGLTQRIYYSDKETLKEVTRFGNTILLLMDALKWRYSGRQPFAVSHHRRKFYLAPFPGKADKKKTMVMVSPFAVFPPAHGGAVRITHLIEEIGKTHAVILLSDEEERYQADALAGLGCPAIYLVGGRYEPPAERGERIPRIKNHCHKALRDELQRLIFILNPSVVQIEYVELAALVDLKKDSRPWIIDLHDVLISDKDHPSEADQFEQKLIERYDVAVACSGEDAALIDHPRIEVVTNGARYMGRPYISSKNRSNILFAGPFRYPPNLSGIEIFLQRVFPRLREQTPGVGLTILGGDGAGKIAEERVAFHQQGVIVHEYMADVSPFFESAAISINPQYQTRGSSLKLIESLALGRVCVSTREGARGVITEGFKGLIIVERIEDFFDPIRRLLSDEAHRLSLETPETKKLDRYTWRHAGALTRHLYSSIQDAP